MTDHIFNRNIYSFPALWDSSHIHYRSIAVKAFCREALLIKLNLELPHPITLSTLRTKINTYQKRILRQKHKLQRQITATNTPTPHQPPAASTPITIQLPFPGFSSLPTAEQELITKLFHTIHSLSNSTLLSSEEYITTCASPPILHIPSPPESVHPHSPTHSSFPNHAEMLALSVPPPASSQPSQSENIISEPFIDYADLLTQDLPPPSSVDSIPFPGQLL